MKQHPTHIPGIPRTPFGRWFFKLRLRVIVSLMSGVVHLFGALLALLQWLVMPFVLLFNLLVLLPLLRWQLKLTARPELGLIDEADVPNWIWRELEREVDELVALKFRKCRYATAKEIAPNGQMVTVSLVHDDLALGVAVNVNYTAAGEVDERRLPPYSTTTEFTLQCRDGTVVDFASSTVRQPLPRHGQRRRIAVPDADIPALVALVRRYRDQTGCVCSKHQLDRLQNDLLGLLQDEFESLLQDGARSGFLRADGDRFRLTWRGAAQVVLRTGWPTSEWIAREEQRATTEVLVEQGVDVDAICFSDETEDSIKPLPDRVETFAAALALAMDGARAIEPDVAFVGMEAEVARESCMAESVTFDFEKITDCPAHRSRKIASFSLVVDCEQSTLETIAPERMIYSYEDWEAYGTDARRPLPKSVAGLVDFETACSRMRDHLAEAGWDASVEKLMLTNHRNHRLVWAADVWLANGEVIELKLDAINGEFA